MYNNIKENTIHFLKKLKENYDYTNRMIAAELDISEVLISNWLAGKSNPNKTNQEKIWNLFHKVWISGIIKFPTCTYWNYPLYLRVADLRNPFETWEDYIYSLDYFNKMLEEYKNISPDPIVIRAFHNFGEYKTKSAEIVNSYNLTTQLLTKLKPLEIYGLVVEGELAREDINFNLLAEAIDKENEAGGSRDERTPTTTN